MDPTDRSHPIVAHACTFCACVCLYVFVCGAPVCVHTHTHKTCSRAIFRCKHSLAICLSRSLSTTIRPLNLPFPLLTSPPPPQKPAHPSPSVLPFFLFSSLPPFSGELSLLNKTPKSASVIAMSPVQVFVLSKMDFFRQFDEKMILWYPLPHLPTFPPPPPLFLLSLAVLCVSFQTFMIYHHFPTRSNTIIRKEQNQRKCFVCV